MRRSAAQLEQQVAILRATCERYAARLREHDRAEAARQAAAPAPDTRVRDRQRQALDYAEDAGFLGMVRRGAWRAVGRTLVKGEWPEELSMMVALNRYVGLTDDGERLARWPETEPDGFTHSSDALRRPGEPCSEPAPPLGNAREPGDTWLHKLAREKGVQV